MRGRVGFWFGLAVGYVLGARAGHERYQQITDAVKSFLENPGTQRLTGEVNKAVTVGKDRATETAASQPPGPSPDDPPPWETGSQDDEGQQKAATRFVET